VTPLKIWPVLGPAYKMAVTILPHERQNRNYWRYFAFCAHKVVDHLQSLDEDMQYDKYLFHQHLLPIFATVRSILEIGICMF